MSELRRQLIASACAKKDEAFGPILPIEYQEVEFVDVNKGAYVNTGIIPTYTHGLYIKLSMNHLHDENNLFGSGNSYQKGYFAESYYTSHNTFIALFGNSQWTKNGCPAVINKIYDYYLNYKNCGRFKVKSENVNYDRYLSTYFSENPECPLYIGNINLDTIPGAESKPDGKIYYIELTKDSKIIKKYVPCRHIASGKVGFYELIDDDFFVSETDIDFIAGPDVFREKEIIPSYFTFGEKLIEDDDYTQVESITSTQRQTMMIPINADCSKFNISVDFMFNEIIKNQPIFTADNLSYFMACMGISDTTKIKVQCGGSGTEIETDALATSTWYNISYNHEAKSFNFNGTNISVSSTAFDSLNLENIKLFSNAECNSSISIKKITISDEDANINYILIPAKRNSDDVTGLYDTVSGEFFTDEINTYIPGKLIFEEGSQEWKDYISDFTETILPEEYQQVKYIESTGKEWIDLGIKPTTNTQWFIDYRFLQFDNPYSVVRNNLQLGAGNPSDSTRFSFGMCGEAGYTSGQAWNISIGKKYYYSKSSIEPDLKRHKIFLSAYRTMRGDIDNSKNYTSFSSLYFKGSDHTINIFRRNHANISADSGYIHAARCYRSEIWESYKLMQDLYPCYRKSDGVSGLYDLKNDVFYTNASNEGELKHGPEEYNVKVFYQTVDHVTATKQQYINTGYYANQDTSVILDITNTSGNSSWQGIFGARGNDDASDNYYGNTFSMYKIQRSGGIRTDYNIDSKSVRLSYMPINEKCHIEKLANVSKIYYVLNSGKIGSLFGSYTHPYAKFTGNYPMYIFTVNSKGNPKELPGCDENIHIFTIKDKNITVRDYIPCRRLSDKKLGMYDRILHKFNPSIGDIDFYGGGDIYYPNQGDIYYINKLKVSQIGSITANDYVEVEESEGDSYILDSISNYKWTCHNVTKNGDLIEFEYGDESYAQATGYGYSFGDEYYIDTDLYIDTEQIGLENSAYVIDFGSVVSTTSGLAPFAINNDGTLVKGEYPPFFDNYKYYGNDTALQYGTTHMPVERVGVDDDGYSHYIIRYGCIKTGKNEYKQFVMANNKVFTSRISHTSKSISRGTFPFYLGRGHVAGYSSACKIKSIKMYKK